MKSRRVPRVEPRGVDADELGDRGDVTQRVVELGAVLRLRRTAEAGADRIDEDQVGKWQPRAFVVLQLAFAGRRAGRVMRGPDPLRAEAGQVQEHRVRPGAAVPEKRERPLRLRGRRVERVCHKEHVAVGLAGLVRADRQQARASRIRKRAAANVELMSCGRGLRVARVPHTRRALLRRTLRRLDTRRRALNERHHIALHRRSDRFVGVDGVAASVAAREDPFLECGLQLARHVLVRVVAADEVVVAARHEHLERAVGRHRPAERLLRRPGSGRVHRRPSARPASSPISATSSRRGRRLQAGIPRRTVLDTASRSRYLSTDRK